MADTQAPPRGIRGHIQAYHRTRRADALAKAIGRAIVEEAAGDRRRSVGNDGNRRQQRQQDLFAAAEQRTRIPGTGVWDESGLFIQRDVREKNGDWDFDDLRKMAKVPPMVAIAKRRREQILRYAKPAVTEGDYVREPGFRIKMTSANTAATDEDRETIELLTQFFSECGWCEPPRDEREPNWQPGFAAFLEQLVDDRLVLNWSVVRTWASDKDPKKFPIVCFAAVDAAQYRRTSRPVSGVGDNGKLITEDYPSDRNNNRGPIEYIKYAIDTTNISDQFTAAELCHWVGYAGTDCHDNGYPAGELELSMDVLKTWKQSYEYNASRFEKDKLPRGFLTILGQIATGKLQAFKFQWSEMMSGNRWGIPCIEGSSNKDSPTAVTWTPLDLSPRDMEYGAWMHMVTLILCANFGIALSELGYDAMSQTRAPLSEASDEYKLINAQDIALGALLQKIAEFLNRSILWRLYPDRRYTLEFLGTGERDAQQEEELIGLQLQNGTRSLRDVWKAKDRQIPESLKDWPGWDMPCPFEVGWNLIQGQQQASAAQQQSEDAAAQNQQSADRQQGMDDQRFQMDQERHDADMESHDMDMEDRLAMAKNGAAGAAGVASTKQGAAPSQVRIRSSDLPRGQSSAAGASRQPKQQSNTPVTRRTPRR